VQGPNYIAGRGQIVVTMDGRPVTTLYPEKRLYTVQNMPMTEAAISPGLTRDLYVSLGIRWARRAGSSACITSLSSTGSGAGASS